MEADEADDELDESDETFGTIESLVTVPVLPSADATVRSGSPSTKYGSTTSLLTDNDGSMAQKHSYLRFAVPAGTYTSAKLRLYVTTASDNAADVYALSNTTWAESTITWNTRPTVDGALLGSIKVATSSSWVEIDVTQVVRGGQPLSLALIPRSQDSAAFASRERSSGKPELVLVRAGSTTPPPPVTASCLSGTGPLVTISGAQSSIYDKRDDLAAFTRVDARTASWTAISNTPVRAGGGDGICWSGGVINGTWDPLTTSWDTYHTTYAHTIFGNNMTVENLRVDNYGDAIHIRNEVEVGNNFTVRGAHVTNNHDDCVQNDGMKSGTVEQSLFDGCYVFFSTRAYGSGPTNTVTIRDNLVRLQAFPTYYGGSTTDPSQYRHGGFWKIDEFDKAPKLSIHNNIFRADQDSRSWIPLTPDPRSIASASNNVIVWLGTGAFPDPVPPGFTVTTDKAVWDNAVAAWKTSHGTP